MVAWGLMVFWVSLALIWMMTGWRLVDVCHVSVLGDSPVCCCDTKIALITADLLVLGLLGYALQLYYTVAHDVEGGLAITGISILEAFLLAYTAVVFLGD